MGWLHLQARSQELGGDVSRQADVHRELKWAVGGANVTSIRLLMNIAAQGVRNSLHEGCIRV